MIWDLMLPYYYLKDIFFSLDIIFLAWPIGNQLDIWFLIDE